MTSFNVSPPPVATRLLIPSINNNLKHHTSITTHSFSDRILVTVGQSSPLLPPKIGTLVLTTFSQSIANNNQKSFDSQILLGRRDDPLLEIYGRQLLEKFSTTDTKGRKELLLGINLREDNRDSETFQEVCNNVLEMLMSQIS